MRPTDPRHANNTKSHRRAAGHRRIAKLIHAILAARETPRDSSIVGRLSDSSVAALLRVRRPMLRYDFGVRQQSARLVCASNSSLRSLSPVGGAFSCDRLSFFQRRRPNHPFDLGDVVRRDAELPQPHAQQQSRINRLAAHFTAHVDRFAGVSPASSTRWINCNTAGSRRYKARRRARWSDRPPVYTVQDHWSQWKESPRRE